MKKEDYPFCSDLSDGEFNFYYEKMQKDKGRTVILSDLHFTKINYVIQIYRIYKGLELTPSQALALILNNSLEEFLENERKNLPRF